MKKILLFILFLSVSMAQIQHEGTPKFFNDQIDGIDFKSIDTNLIIDRNFHPMVFQFGREYEIDVNILDEALVFIDGDMYTFIYAISSPACTTFSSGSRSSI